MSFHHFLYPATALIALSLGYLLRPTPILPNESSPDVSHLAAQTGQTISFRELITETTGRQIIRYDQLQPAHQAIVAVIQQALDEACQQLSQPDSPVQSLRRINEASRYFEDLLSELIQGHPDFDCRLPHTRSGLEQRSGYPDLRIEHLPSGTIAYLDPKLFQEGSQPSSFRSFYYEASTESGKITEDALHLLLGISHNGQPQQWVFTPAHLVDLHGLKVRLKAEFSASNRDLYQAGLSIDSPKNSGN